jgi:bacterioferritin
LANLLPSRHGGIHRPSVWTRKEFLPKVKEGKTNGGSKIMLFFNFSRSIINDIGSEPKSYEEVKNMAVSLKPMTKVSDKLRQMLNDAIAREIQVSIQYMWQHVQAVGVKGVAVQDQFKQTAIAEMKHAEKIAERLWYLEGTPTTKPAPINIGGSLKEFLELDTKAEEEAIKMYKEIIELAQKEGDVTTAFIFKEILEDEEEHHDLFTTMLEEV